MPKGNCSHASATPEHRTIAAAIIPPLPNIRRLPPLYFCHSQHPTTAAAILPPLPSIRRLLPLYFRHSRTSDDYRRYTFATPEHPTTAAAILPPLPNIRRLPPLYFRHSRTGQSSDLHRMNCCKTVRRRPHRSPADCQEKCFLLSMSIKVPRKIQENHTMGSGASARASKSMVEFRARAGTSHCSQSVGYFLWP